MCDCRAFTLVEVLLVVVLIALVAGVGAGLFVGRYDRRLLEKTANHLVLAARYARMVALERQTPCKLNIDRNARRVYLTILQVDRQTGQATEAQLPGHCFKPFELTNKIELGQLRVTPTQTGSDRFEDLPDDDQPRTENVIVFYPNGTADAALLPIADSKRSYTLIVSAATGKARLERGEVADIPEDVVDLDA